MGQVSVNLDEGIAVKGLNITGYKKIDVLVEEALREFIHKRDGQRLLELKGRIHWEGNLDELRMSRI
ncbi:MAG: type II toxin-antitoxin system VapB family antitoxin [Elusimicrobiota bacterium]